MNAVLIVLPILTLLMFELGLTLELKDFRLFLQRPKPVVAGLIGQLLLLPILAVGLGIAFRLEPLFFIGLVLIACSPGGSSSNIFSLVARGDVALSVLLTALSSILTLFTIPIIMQFAVYLVGHTGTTIHLPIGRLILQNIVLVLTPVLIGVSVRHYRPATAEKIHLILSKVALPSLILLATLFFVQHYAVIAAAIGQLGLCITLLILLAMGGGIVLSRGFRLTVREQRTLVIEIGMQNAAQAIAIASSPFIFNNDVVAVPAILYALLMNVILLSYLFVVRRRKVDLS